MSDAITPSFQIKPRTIVYALVIYLLALALLLFPAYLDKGMPEVENKLKLPGYAVNCALAMLTFVATYCKEKQFIYIKTLYLFCLLTTLAGAVQYIPWPTSSQHQNEHLSVAAFQTDFMELVKTKNVKGVDNLLIKYNLLPAKAATLKGSETFAEGLLKNYLIDVIENVRPMFNYIKLPEGISTHPNELIFINA